MGKKIRTGKISIVIPLFILFSVLTDSISTAFARPPIVDLDLKSAYQLSEDPLTTDLAWKLDPLHLNPHLQRWALSRSTKIIGLQTTLRSDGKFGVKAIGIFSSVQGYIRPYGPWYRDFSEFDCAKEPNSWFATHAGVQFAAATAADLWAELLKKEKIKLSLLLERVIADSESLALERGNEVFRTWLHQAEADWRVLIQHKVRPEEWKFYSKEAVSLKLCPLKKPKSGTPPTWTTMMEKVSGEAPDLSQVLARAPARLWNGLFSVRLNVTVGDKVLNGRFLIDSAAGKSLMSPSWLSSQGIDPAWVIIPGSLPRRVSWGDLWESEGGLARVAFVDHINLGGLDIALNEFLLYETDFFGPPENVGSCCDGILGSDFLKLYPIEFKSEVPAEVRVWPRENFHLAPEVPWVEVTQGLKGDLVSGCAVFPESDSKSKNSSQSRFSLLGVRWDTGGDDALEIHTPWQKSVSSFSQSRWKIQCESFPIASGIVADFPKPPGGRSDEGQLSTKVPATSIGMPVLSSGKSFTFDLPHGRLWFQGGERILQGSRQDRSGLKVQYDINDEGDRELRVVSIRPGSPAQTLAKSGLKSGMLITQIDAKRAEDIDLWEVERRLAGDYGDTVTVQWKTKGGLKMAPLQVR